MCVFAVDNFWSRSSGAFAEDGNEYLDTTEVGKLLTQNIFKQANTLWYHL